FSFGVVIYEMLTGKTPFAEDSASETFVNLLNAEPQPLSRVAVNLPDELQRIVSKMLREKRGRALSSDEGCADRFTRFAGTSDV
ncbi:MAG: hypothetical protein ABR566_18220, partial [Pyrinomonadaceae bacterium]